jgi:hypothetical protein
MQINIIRADIERNKRRNIYLLKEYVTIPKENDGISLDQFEK